MTADRDRAGQNRLPQTEDQSGPVNDGHHEGEKDHPRIRQMPCTPSKLDIEASSPSLRQHHRRLPVIPRPRFPAAILPTPSLAAMFAPSVSTTATFHNIMPLTHPPFCFTPSVDYSTAVPPSSSTLASPLPPLFGFCHPAFWGAMPLPYLIGRALLGAEQVRDDPVSRFPVENDPQSPCQGLRQCSSKSWEPPAICRQFCDPVSPSDAGLRPLREAASSGLDDMAKMVSRLDEAKKMIV